MKSIKEKAEEYSFIDEVVDSDGKVLYTDCSLSKRNAFETGANYVLDAIEDIIVNNEDNTLNMAKCLVDCIKQLKSNQ